MAKAKKTTELNLAELGKILAEKRAEIQSLAFKGAGAKVSNVRQPRALRREIARVLTLANQSSKKNT